MLIFENIICYGIVPSERDKQGNGSQKLSEFCQPFPPPIGAALLLEGLLLRRAKKNGGHIP
jgi:hypothetical protein